MKIYAVIATAMILTSCDNSPEARVSRNCRDDGMAFVMSQKFVKGALRAPSSASFPSRPTASSKKAECKFLIRGYVDSQNGFGAMIRSNYSIDMEYLPTTNNWRGTNLRM